MSSVYLQRARPISMFTVILAVIMLASCTTVDTSKKKLIPYPEPPDVPRFYWERTLRGSADIAQDSSQDLLRRMVTGEKKTGKGIVKPYGIVVSKGRVFVADTAAAKVFVFDVPAKNFYEIGDLKGPGLLQKPMTVAIDAQDNLYIVDTGDKTVKEFTAEGKYLATFAGGKDDLDRPTGIAVTPDGSRIYVVDTGGVTSKKHHVRVYDTATNKRLFDIGQRGTLEGEFNLPNNIAMGKDGNLYVVDGGNFRIQVLDQQGNFIRSFGEIGRLGGQFSRPKGIALDGDDNVYVVDAAFGNFQIFNSKGQLLMYIGKRQKRGAAGEYFLPAGIAVDEDGRVYVGDQFFRKIDVYRPAALKENEGYLGYGLQP
ncbi:MAG: 6-bladed beta-propeller [Nitrospinota bacterium]